MLERLPFYGQLLLFGALAVGVVAAAYFIWPALGTTQAQIATLEEEYAQKDAEIRKGLAIEQRLPDFEREVADLQEDLADVQQILPTNRETGDLLRWIKNVGDQSNLDLKSFSPGSLRAQEFYKEFPIEMQIVGRYHDLGMFLDRVSKYQRIINVDNLQIGQSNDANKTIRASFNATTFVYEAQADQEATR